MSSLSEAEERDAVDFITNNIYSTLFSKDISDAIFSRDGALITLDDFYKKWTIKVSHGILKIPFSPGQVLGNLYTSIVLGKENWWDLLPNTPFSVTDMKWGLTGGAIKWDTNPDPPLKELVRRLRNAIAHANVKFVIPKNITREEMLEKISIKFHDETRGGGNPFDGEFSLIQLLKFNRQYHHEIHEYVKSKYDITEEELEKTVRRLD